MIGYPMKSPLNKIPFNTHIVGYITISTPVVKYGLPENTRCVDDFPMNASMIPFVRDVALPWTGLPQGISHYITSLQPEGAFLPGWLFQIFLIFHIFP